jgi:RNA polymerase sigma factor (sigma-70 family)
VHIGDFDGRSSFATWVTRIAINSALMILRKRRTTLEIVTIDQDDPAATEQSYKIPDRAPNPERRCLQNEKARALKKAVQALRPSLREVVELQQLQERSRQETAEMMCISVAAAKSRLLQGRAAQVNAIETSDSTTIGHRTRCSVHRMTEAGCCHRALAHHKNAISSHGRLVVKCWLLAGLLIGLAVKGSATDRVHADFADNSSTPEVPVRMAAVGEKGGYCQDSQQSLG